MRDEILNLKNAKRIAIMGGTFDPVHYGHLVTAEAVRHQYNIEQVVFIPTGVPSHKLSDVTHSEHRYLMTVLATVNNPYFSVSRMEIDRAKVTYTIDTIRELREICGEETKIYFITGADAIAQILTWKDAEVLLTLCSFIAVTRPGYNTEKLHEQVNLIKEKFKSKLHFLEVPALAISSTDIRSRAGEGMPIKYLLPEEVEEYIFKHNLYGNATLELSKFSFDEIEADIKATLKEERFLHVKGVVFEAEKLGQFYNADAPTLEKIKLAALLHDCAKCLDDVSMKEFCKEKGIKLDDVLKKNINLAHGFVGAEIAKEKYGVTDEDILNAIKYHTFGRENMSFIEKIVCVADFIEPYRKEFQDMQRVRRAAYLDLDMALYLRIKNNITFNSDRKKPVFDLSVKALEWLKPLLGDKIDKQTEVKNGK